MTHHTSLELTRTVAMQKIKRRIFPGDKIEEFIVTAIRSGSDGNLNAIYVDLELKQSGRKFVWNVYQKRVTEDVQTVPLRCSGSVFSHGWQTKLGEVIIEPDG